MARAAGRSKGLDEKLVYALAEVAAPRGARLPAFDGASLEELEGLLGSFGARAVGAYGGLLHTLDLAAIPLTGRRLSRLPPDRRLATLTRLFENDATFWMARGAIAPLRAAQVRRRDSLDRLGVPHGVSLPMARERHRYEERIVDGRSFDADATFEVDAVIVGTGAGGAPLAHALAKRGHAVLILEEGGHHRRDSFHGRPIEMLQSLVRPELTIALGNAAIPIPIGKTVGGTTTINSGTCFRPTADLFRRWRFEHGLVDLDPESLAPHYENVERMLKVATATPETLGGCARVVARGAERLGWSHGPLRRNAPGCDGQGVCAFGCPTDAKRSTNVSYVPAALEAGAELITHARVECVLLEGGRAVGVVARVVGSGAGRTITVRARAVALACGSLHTPLLLLRQGLANGSGEVGKNLTIHPASHAWARFDERIEGYRAIPQGYEVDEFVGEGIRLEGAFVPLEMAAATSLMVGPSWTDFIERFDHMACFGFMIDETSRGTVRLGAGGGPLVRYRVNEDDRRLLLRGQALVTRLFLAAGAREVYPASRGVPAIRDEAGLAAFEAMGERRLRPRHLDISAYHPLGTCRMGVDPRRSVVGPTNECHDVPGLFIVDGSTLNGPLGVNPQVTIMAFSERASAFVERCLERADRRGARATDEAAPAALEFRETMQGTLRFEDGADARPVSFTVRASAPELGAVGRGLARARGARLRLEGTLDLEGLARGAACEGSLTIAPRKTKGTLVYDLAFTGDDGAPYRLYGQKHALQGGPARGMTTLFSELTRGDAGRPLARGTIAFDFRDLFSFLGTWRVRVRAGASPSSQPRSTAEEAAAYSSSSAGASSGAAEPSGSSVYSARSVSATGGSAGTG